MSFANDKLCEAAFAPVTTKALRLAVKLPSDWAAGVHEWKSIMPDAEGQIR